MMMNKAFLPVVAPVFFAIANAFAAFLGLAALGVFSKGSYVRYNGMIYKVTEDYTSRLSEEYELVGTLEQTEDPRKAQEDMVTNKRLIKKAVSVVLILIVAVAVLAAILLSDQKTINNDIGFLTYEYAQSDQVIKPALTLEENHHFEFFYSVESSYKANGTFEIENKHLNLATTDGKYLFVFYIKNEILVFDLDISILPPDFTNVDDKASFVPVTE